MFNRMRSICFGSTQRWRLGSALLAASAAAAPAVFGQGAGLVKTLGGTGVAGYYEGGRGLSQFHTPVALAVRGDGYLFIADRDNNAVRQLNLAGTNITTTFVHITQPVGLAFDSKTNLFIASGADGSITQYDYFKNYRQTLHPTLTAGPITALAIDRNDNLYVAEQGGLVIRFNTNGVVDTTLSAPTAGPHEFRGVAVSDDGIIFASDAAAQVIWKFVDGQGELFAGVLNQAGSSQGEQGFGRLNSPQQIAVGPNRSVVIADRGNQQVRVASCDGVITVLYGIDPALWTYGPAPQFEPGWYDSPVGPQYSEVREPVGIATDSTGNVYDTEVYYHLVRGTTGALQFPAACDLVGTPSPTNAPPTLVLDPGSGFYPSGVTITISASNSISGFSRDTHLYYRLDGLPPTQADTEISISDDGRARLTLPGPIDLAKLRVRAFVGTVGGPVATATPTQVPTPVLTPDSGYYPMGVDVVITSTNGFPDGTLLYYTLDGTLPTTNSIGLDHDGSRAVLSWNHATQDLRSLKVRAFLGPNQGDVSAGRAVSFPGEPTIQGEIGIPPARNGYKAGIGSYYILPIVANLRDRQQLLSLQFVVELSPIGNAPRLDRTDLQVLPMSTNDFIQVLSASTLPPDSTISVARNGTNRLAIAYFGTNSGFNVSAGFATVALLGIQFRAEDNAGNQASFGDAYKLRITQVTGTSDGVQTLLPLKSMDDIIIQFQNIPFREGDTSPAYWYNAGDFGNGILEGADVNRAIFAAFGFLRPFPLSDASAAMDVYRVGVLENVVEYNDAATILRRSLGFESQDFFRVRNDDGEWGPGIAPITAQARSLVRALSSDAQPVWSRDVTIQGGVVDKITSLQSVHVPVYMKVRPGANVSGMQFVADVLPVDGAPAINGVTFEPSGTIKSPRMNGSDVPGLGHLPNTVYALWDDLPTPLTGTVLLGHIQFVTPSSVLGGEHYNIVFHNTGGAAIDPITGDLQGYLFESIHGEVWPFQGAPDVPQISDDWKAHFFGSMDAAAADQNADPDGDGLTNVEEYLAGSDPGTPDWRIKSQGGHVFFRWVGRAGKHYTVQSTSDLKGWNTVSGQLTGQDGFLQFDEAATPTARFYRLNIQ